MSNHGLRGCLIVALMWGMPPACADQGNPPPGAPAHPEGLTSAFALYALSRGTGVPEATRRAFEKARRLLEEAEARGEVKRMQETRIGLEGETRLCVEFKDVKVGRRILAQVRKVVQGVDLLNLVDEPCEKP